MKPLTFHHLTMNTGHVTVQHDFTPEPPALRVLAAMAPGSGQHPLPPPFEEFSVLIDGDAGAGVFTLFVDLTPRPPLGLVTCTFCEDERAEAWKKAHGR